jgi:hypothetical protein
VNIIAVNQVVSRHMRMIAYAFPLS